MSHSERSQSSGTARGGAPDAQSLIALLENLVPLLLRLQAQTSQPFQVPPPDPVIQSAVLDHQAAVSFTEDIIADALRNASSYVEDNKGRHPGLEPCDAIIAQARHSFAARDYAQSFALILQVYRAAAALRIIKPNLPPIGRGAESRDSSLH